MSRIPLTTLAPHVSIGTSAPDPVGPTAQEQGLRITELRPGDVRTVLAARIGFAFPPGVRAACAKAFRDPETADSTAGFGERTERIAARLVTLLHPAVAAVLDAPEPVPSQARERPEISDHGPARAPTLRTP